MVEYVESCHEIDKRAHRKKFVKVGLDGYRWLSWEWELTYFTKYIVCERD